MNRRGSALIVAVVIVGLLIICGIWYYGTRQYIPTQVPAISQNGATTTVADLTSTASKSNWKTYRNNALGIEIKYPSDWYGPSEVSDSYVGITSEPLGDATKVKPSQVNGYKVEIYLGIQAPFDDLLPATQTLEEWEQGSYQEVIGTGGQISTSTITIDGQKGIRTISESDAGAIDTVDFVVLSKKNAIVSIDSIGTPSSIFNAMLASFHIVRQ